MSSSQTLRDASAWIEMYMPNESIGVKYLIYSNAITMVVTDSQKFAAFLSLINNELDQTDYKIQKEYLLMDLNKHYSTIEKVRKIALEKLPEHEQLIATTPVNFTFSPIFNAQVSKEYSGILIFNGVLNFKFFANIAMHLNESFAYEAQYQMMLQTVIKSMSKLPAKHRWSEEKVAEYVKTTMYPPKKPSDMITTLAQEFKLSLEITGLRLPSYSLLFSSGSILEKRASEKLFGMPAGLRPPSPAFSNTATAKFSADLERDIILPFIYFHELGHIVLRHRERDPDLNAFDPYWRSDAYVEIRQQQEIEADLFAVSALLRTEVNYEVVRCGINLLYQLLLNSEIRLEVLPVHKRSTVLGTTENSSRFEGWINRHAQVRTKYHPPALARYSYVWEFLRRHVPRQDKPEIDIRNLDDESYVIAMASGIKEIYEYEDIPTEIACEKLLERSGLGLGATLKAKEVA